MVRGLLKVNEERKTVNEVMHHPSSSRGCSTSASVTVTVNVANNLGFVR